MDRSAWHELVLCTCNFVESVGEGAAADAGVRTGDVILRIDNKAVSSVDEFKQLLDKLPQGKSVAILVQRRGGPIFLALKVPEAD